MFNYVYGKLVEVFDGIAVVDCNGLGYELNVSDVTLADVKVGENVKLLAYLQVKEDGVALYGFSTQTEKSMFLRLISVSGIGCKVAQSILSGITAGDLASAIYNGNVKLLTKVKGLGKKTAERIILELREKVEGLAQDTKAVPQATFNKQANDAISVLVSLGLSQQDATARIETAMQQGAQTSEELINMAFRLN